jgi:hypothetical protein
MARTVPPTAITRRTPSVTTVKMSSGTSGTSGSGTSGSGTSGTSGSGTIGTSGIGTGGTSGTSGYGTSGTSGSGSGISGTSGTRGTSGSSGIGAPGTSGTSGLGISGTSGTRGTSGSSGSIGLPGTSGTSGLGSSVINVRDYGAVGDGVTDDSLAFINAINDADGRTVYAPAGTYRMGNSGLASSFINTTKDLSLMGDGASTLLDFTGPFPGGYGIKVSGTASMIESLSGTQQIGSYNVTFDSAPSLSIGDVFVIFNPATSSFSNFRSYYYAGEWCEVDDISANTVRLKNRLYDTYNADDVEVYKITSPNVHLRDFSISGATIEGLIWTNLCIAPKFENITATHQNNSAIFISRCFKPLCVNANIDNKGDGGDDYGIVITNSQHSKIIGGNIYSRRHAIAHGGGPGICSTPVRDSRIISTTLKNDASSLVHCADFHGNAEDCSFIDCTIYGGATFQGKDIKYDNCTIYDFNGICIYSGEILGGYHEASNCRFITFQNPQLINRGIIDFGGNSTTCITEDTILDSTIIIKNSTLYGRNLGSLTSFLAIRNRGSFKKINVIVENIVIDVDIIKSILYTDVISGIADSNYMIVNNITGQPPATIMHNSYQYAGFPHLTQNSYNLVSTPNTTLGTFFKGVGTPEGYVTASIGTLYTNANGGTSSTIYVKVSGTGSTGWRNIQL